MTVDHNNIKKDNLENEEMSLKDLVLKIKVWIIFLNSKWKILFFSIMFGSIIGLSIAWLIKPSYKAILTFAMEEDKGGGGGLSGALGLASSFGIDLGGGGGGGAFAASNLIELMKSRLIVEKVLLEPVYIRKKKFSLIDYYIERFGLRKEWNNIASLKNIHYQPNTERQQFNLQQDSIIQLIYNDLIENNISISQKDKKVTILTIEVKSKDELFSKLFCEGLAKETSDFYIETKSKRARINVNVLQKQVDSIKTELNGAISSVATETDNVYNLNPAYNIKGAPSKKKQIDVQANTAILTNLVVQLELAKITLRKETPLIQLIDRPNFPLEKNNLGKIKSFFLGGILAFFLAILYLIIEDALKKMFA